MRATTEVVKIVRFLRRGSASREKWAESMRRGALDMEWIRFM